MWSPFFITIKSSLTLIHTSLFKSIKLKFNNMSELNSPSTVIYLSIEQAITGKPK